jgi:hypothetical protein
VLETRNVDGYTYLRLKATTGEVWAAVPTSGVKVGAQVTIASPMTMDNFQSKTLGKTFDHIVFGQLAEPGAAPGKAHGELPATAAAASPAAAKPVAKAKGPDARTVAEVVDGKAKLAGKTVLVQARVVKVNNGIMGKNWLHVQDGSGNAAAGSNDILVTSKETAAVGDIVTARGTVRNGVDLGSGYTYPVLIEDAKLVK